MLYVKKHYKMESTAIVEDLIEKIRYDNSDMGYEALQDIGDVFRSQDANL